MQPMFDIFFPKHSQIRCGRR